MSPNRTHWEARKLEFAAGYFAAVLRELRRPDPCLYVARSYLVSAWNQATFLADPDMRARASQLRNAIDPLLYA